MLKSQVDPLKAKSRFFMNGIRLTAEGPVQSSGEDKGSPAEKPEVFVQGPMVMKQVLSLFVEEEADICGPFWGPKNRYDFLITKTGSKLKTEYEVKPTRKYAKVDTSELEENLIDVQEEFNHAMTYEELEALLNGEELPDKEDEEEEDEESSEEEEGDDEESAEEDEEADEDDDEEEAPKKGKKSSKKDEEEEDEEEDEDDDEEEADEDEESAEEDEEADEDDDEEADEDSDDEEEEDDEDEEPKAKKSKKGKAAEEEEEDEEEEDEDDEEEADEEDEDEDEEESSDDDDEEEADEEDEEPKAKGKGKKKPVCFGDPDDHDPKSSACKECPFNKECAATKPVSLKVYGVRGGGAKFGQKKAAKK
jgi:hypothetical protein